MNSESPKKTIKALVTGASGFVGTNVARELLAHGRDVRVLVRPTSSRKNIENLPVEPVLGDLTEKDTLMTALKDCHELYHVAAEYTLWSKDRNSIYKNNIDGTHNLLSSAFELGTKKVIYTSTVGTIGLRDQPNPCNEETPTLDAQFSGDYKRSKFEAEQIAKEFSKKGLPLVIVNPSAPVGPWDIKPTPTGQMILDFMRGKMPGVVDSGLNIVHVADVARGHRLAAEKGRIGERYILGGENLSLQEIFTLLAHILGRTPPRLKIPYPLAYLAGWFSTKLADRGYLSRPLVALEAVKMARYTMFFSSEKAQNELGYTFRSAQEALVDSVEWFAKNYSV